jgi:hypothetical protein
MLAGLKFLHFLALWMAGGAGVGGWVIQHIHSKSGSRPTPEVLASVRTMGLIALLAVLMLWGSGLTMIYGFYGGIMPIPAFYVKLVVASVLLLASLSINLETVRAKRAGTPPRQSLMTALTWTIRVSLAAVIAAAVVAFS